MPYVTSIERIGIQKGIEQGVLQNAQEDVIDVLEVRFHGIPESIVEAVNAIEDASALRALHREAVTVASLEEFEGVLEKCSSGE